MLTKMSQCALISRASRVFSGIDTSNLITSYSISGSGSQTYTATQDCWAIVNSGGQKPIVTTLNGVYVGGTYGSNEYPSRYIIPLKYDQTIVSTNSSTISGNIYIWD